MSHKNFDALRKAVLEKAKEGMRKEVLPVVQEQMKDSVTEEVYKVYTPLQYERRRYSGGGLGDTSMMKGYVVNSSKDGFEYFVQNEARARRGRGLLTPLVVKGSAWAILSDYILKYDYFPSYDHMYAHHRGGRFVPFYEARDFISHTKDNLDKKELAKKLNDYMKK